MVYGQTIFYVQNERPASPRLSHNMPPPATTRHHQFAHSTTEKALLKD
jgi:hypothetical protein